MYTKLNGCNPRYPQLMSIYVDLSFPLLFKPLGSPRPRPGFIASDADFADYITALMGGAAIPHFLKNHRQGKRYLLIGLRLTHDTEQLVLANIIHGAGRPPGWALIPDPTPKEQLFCRKVEIELVQADIHDWFASLEANRSLQPTPNRTPGAC
jgi:hypothetical protein